MNLVGLMFQFLGFWIWVAVWFCVAFVGEESIHTPPIQVNKDVSENYELLGDYGQKYFMTYSLLFIFVTVHNTIRIQLAHTTHSKYHPFTKLYCFATISLLITAIVSVVTE